MVNINQGVPKRWYEESVHFSECTCGGSILTADEKTVVAVCCPHLRSRSAWGQDVAILQSLCVFQS